MHLITKIEGWLKEHPHHGIQIVGDSELWTLTLTLYDLDTKTSFHNSLIEMIRYLDEQLTIPASKPPGDNSGPIIP